MYFRYVLLRWKTLMILLSIENCFVMKPNAWILTVWFTSTKKNNKHPSCLHLYYGGCPCRRKDSPLSRNENVTKVLPICSYFYFFISIKKSWILLYKRTTSFWTCFKYSMRRSSHICTQIKKDEILHNMFENVKNDICI